MGRPLGCRTHRYRERPSQDLLGRGPSAIEAQVRTDPRATLDVIQSLLDLEAGSPIASPWASGPIGQELDLAFGALDGWCGTLKVRLDPRAGQSTMRLDCGRDGFGLPNESHASVTCDLFVGRCAVLVAPTRLPDRTLVVLVSVE